MASNKTTYSPMRNGNTTLGKSPFNGITSTPLASRSRQSNSLFSPSKITALRTPPRYSLSETSNRSETLSKGISSPLLKSSKYNSNLAAYMDGKSPGLHSRIVQYSNEARDNLPVTHQAKYGSPGLFPVVHFFKKETPVITPKPKRVMVRLASPDVHWYNNTSLNKSNLNHSADIRSGHFSPQISAETETRSVLDALREISRKRIHADSEFESTSDAACKRQKRADPNNITYETNKRAREDSPTSDASNTASPLLHQPKKVCVVDVLAASFTSSQLLKEKMQSLLKRKPEVEIEETIVQTDAKRQTISSNAETQTINIEQNVVPQKLSEKATITVASDKTVEGSNGIGDGNKEQQEEEAQRQSIIFDERKLEVQRKNKLAMLIGAITGEKPNLISYTNSSEEKSDNDAGSENKLVGILSPMNKAKHDKHVHFNLTPEVKSIDSNTPALTEIQNIDEKRAETTVNSDLDSEILKSVPKSKPESNINFGVTSQTSSATLSTTTTTTSSLGNPIVTTMVTTAIKTSESSDINPISNLSFSFDKPSTSSYQETPKKAITTASSQVSGGFKFNLSPTNITTSAITPTTVKPISNSTPTFNFGGMSTSPTVSNTSVGPNLSNSLNAAPKSVTSTFGSTVVNHGGDKLQTNLPAFGTIGNTTATIISSPPSFGLPSTISNATLVTNKGAHTTSSTPSLSGFGVISTAPIIGSTQSSMAQAKLTFGGNKTPGFGSNTTTASQFGTNTVPTFGATTTSNSMFGTPKSAVTVSNNLAYNTSAVSVFSTTAVPPSFVGNPTTGFGNPIATPASVTSALSTTASGLGTTPTPGFGATTSTTGFGVSNPIPAFGTTTSSSMFGVNTSTPSFGAGMPIGFPIETTTSGFNTVNSSGFGTATTSTPAFSTTSAFGVPTTPASSLSKLPTPNFNFGSGNNFGTSGFGGTNAFGIPPTSTPGFGIPSTASSGFGTATTNTAAFGGTGNTNFNNKFGFGVPSTTSTTGFTMNNAFGATTTASSGFPSSGSFGAVSQANSVFGNNSAFGSKAQTTASSMFGNSTFGATTTASSAFGTNTTGFGNQSITNFFKNTTSGFTATTTAPPTFASNNTQSKPFTFGTGTANTTGFNNNSTFNFGGANPSGFPENKQSGFGTFPSTGFGTNTSTMTSTTTNSTTSIFGSTGGFGNSAGFGSSTFGGNNSTPAPPFRNANANTFVTSNNNNTFSTPTNNNTFGTATNTPNFGFGNGDASSTFNKPQASSGFGLGAGDSTFQFGGSNNNISTPVFGAANPTNNTSAGTGQVFSFGASNPVTSPSTGVFAFGTPEQKSNFPSNNNTSGFATATPNFNSNTVTGNFGTPQFGTPTPGMFSIGSGSNTGPRQRHQLKAKRRT